MTAGASLSRTLRGAAIVAAMLAVALPAAARATACDAGSLARIPDLKITRAALVLPKDRAAPAAGEAICRVDAVIGKEIGTQFWLPEGARWNGRIIAVGVGGQAGSIPEGELARLSARGYAAMSNDSGHKASDTHWLLGDPERAANYAGLANHRMADAGRALVAAFYGREARKRFFIGCSGGGRQAMTEVQRYPLDFDGVIAGAPGVNTPEMSARRMWEMGVHARAGSLLTAATWRLVADAAVKACDPLDGARDGILGNPFQCRFDPAALLCRKGAGAAAGACLSKPQIDVVRRVFAPLRDEDGRVIDGGLLPGTPVTPVPLPEPFTPGPTYLAVALFGQGVHRNPDWDARTFRIADDLPAIDRVMNLHADDPDLDRFRAAGGKLILYQGLADPLVSAISTVDYYEALRRRYGTGAAEFARLFLVPGMDHCTGGGVPDRFGALGGDGTVRDPLHDMLSALEAWGEEGRAPTHLIAVQGKGHIRSRPICAYPAAARYRGGPIDAAASFDCGGVLRQSGAPAPRSDP